MQNWLGPWAVAPLSDVTVRIADLAELTRLLQSLRAAQALQDNVLEHAQQVPTNVWANTWDVSLEVCGDTFAVRREIIMHCACLCQERRKETPPPGR